jgi:aquaporin Z
MKQYFLMELLGTFFLALAVCLATGDILTVGLSIGLMLAAVIYLGWHVSGAHYNPSISLAEVVRGTLDPRNAVIYMTMQTVGAVLAFGLVHSLGYLKVMSLGVGHTFLSKCTFEMLLTFLFVIVVITIADKYRGGDIHGLIIGLTLAVAVILGGLINPAIIFAGLLVGVLRSVAEAQAILPVAFALLLSSLVGGALAAYVYNFFNKKKRK